MVSGDFDKIPCRKKNILTGSGLEITLDKVEHIYLHVLCSTIQRFYAGTNEDSHWVILWA